MDAPDLVNLPSGCTARPVTRDDLDAVLALVRACEAHDTGAAELDREDLEADWNRPVMDLSTMTLAVFEGGEMIAEAEVVRNRGEVSVHPAHRGRGIGSALLPWVEAVARTQGSHCRQVVHDGATGAAALLAAHGYENAFTSWILGIPLDEDLAPPRLPDGIAFRDYEPGVGDEEIHRLIDDAFGEWDDREPAAFEDWAALTIRRPSFQPWHMILTADEATGELVGTAYLIDYEGVDAGWIQQLATKATHRHQGIARAMLHRAFGLYRDRGKTSAEIQTDSRTGALGLYEKVGMRVLSSYTNYVKAFEAGERS
jgi:GNAT superfamily N-acetyltransferase